MQHLMEGMGSMGSRVESNVLAAEFSQVEQAQQLFRPVDSMSALTPVDGHEAKTRVFT